MILEPYSKNKFILLLVALAAVVLGLVWMFLSVKQDENNGPVACTLEAKICPDGTAVGRTGPNCEFAQCP